MLIERFSFLVNVVINGLWWNALLTRFKKSLRWISDTMCWLHPWWPRDIQNFLLYRRGEKAVLTLKVSLHDNEKLELSGTTRNIILSRGWIKEYISFNGICLVKTKASAICIIFIYCVHIASNTNTTSSMHKSKIALNSERRHTENIRLKVYLSWIC